MLKIKNGKARCVGYNDSERYFAIGKIYNVIDNTIVDDTDFKYNLHTPFRQSNEVLLSLYRQLCHYNTYAY